MHTACIRTNIRCRMFFCTNKFIWQTQIDKNINIWFNIQNACAAKRHLRRQNQRDSNINEVQCRDRRGTASLLRNSFIFDICWFILLEEERIASLPRHSRRCVTHSVKGVKKHFELGFFWFFSSNKIYYL